MYVIKKNEAFGTICLGAARTKKAAINRASKTLNRDADHIAAVLSGSETYKYCGIPTKIWIEKE